MPGRKGTGRLRPLKVTEAMRTFVLDQLDGLGDVVARSMFGGVGLYCNGCFFGIIAGDALYLKVDESNRADFERAGMTPFAPYPDRAVTMQYYAVPVDVLESAPELVAWARKAVAVGEASAARKRPRRRTANRRGGRR